MYGTEVPRPPNADGGPGADPDADPGASRPKGVVDQWFDLFVYAPLGLALDARRLLPRLVDRGRSQVVLARAVGRYAVQHGQDRAGSYLGRSHTQVAAVLQALGLLAEESEVDGGQDLARFEAVDVSFAGQERVLGAPAEVPLAAPIHDPVDLAIPDYDTLSASQVVPRLGGLTPDELEAVRRYELSARGRQTILGKIVQLQSG